MCKQCKKGLSNQSIIALQSLKDLRASQKASFASNVKARALFAISQGAFSYLDNYINDASYNGFKPLNIKGK